MSDSGQKFIRRNRAPRVHIAYDDPYDANRKIELPFVMGVLADLSGNNAGVEKPDMSSRGFVDIDMDNFDARMKGINPGVNIAVPNRLGEGGDKLGVSLRFEKMADFDPGAIARQTPALAKLLEARQHLANLRTYMDGKAAAETKLRQLLADPTLMATLREKLPQGDDKSTDEAE